tara:strand:- start:2747 stop:3133 length:387 start_codon:yes stop_codon:yes gene_type:complete
MDHSTATEFLKAVEYYYEATFPDQDGNGGLNPGVDMTDDQHAEWVWGFKEVIDQFKQKLDGITLIKSSTYESLKTENKKLIDENRKLWLWHRHPQFKPQQLPPLEDGYDALKVAQECKKKIDAKLMDK